MSESASEYENEYHLLLVDMREVVRQRDRLLAENQAMKAQCYAMLWALCESEARRGEGR